MSIPATESRVPGHSLEVETAVTEDLHNLGESNRLCDWMFHQYAHGVRGDVAEVGAGIGTFSRRILDGGAERLLIVEPAESCHPELKRAFGGDPRVEITGEVLPESPSLAAGGFQLVVCQNVLEHIADDASAVDAMANALAPGGRLALLVPAHPRLFGPLDSAYGHYRRYTRRRVRGLLQGAGLRIEVLKSFNALGIPGWWAKNRKPGQNLDPRSLRAYEAMVRFWRPVEDRVPLPWGLSIVAHGVRD